MERNNDEIARQAADDKNIDLAKIKKYFKDVINEQNFLDNYARVKAANSQQNGRKVQATQQERLMMENRM